MQRMGASAVVVGDNINSPTLVSMYAGEDASDVKIPSVFISKGKICLIISNLLFFQKTKTKTKTKK